MARGGLLALLLAVLPGSVRADASLEYAVKAAYLAKFIPFVTWPQSAFVGPGAPFNICILGENHFGDRLEKAAAEARGTDHPVQVRHLTAPDAGCHLLFLSAGTEPALLQGALDASQGRPVLTVIDSGLNARGVINFMLQDNHVRFDIDDAQAAENGLTVSSKLLGLAHAVRPRGQP